MIPLDSVEEALSWRRPAEERERSETSAGERPLQSQCGLPIYETEVVRRNKVLFCHDMKGGYLDDATIEDNGNIYAYRFYHWHLIDIFVYFSHHFVTIPPTGWIRQAHKNGVQCLGTLIIEHADNFMKLFSLDNCEVVAKQLNEIRKFYNFDGWLINIECEVEHNESQRIVDNICKFLKYLSTFGNEVIWYDAITASGKLKWQNCLNKENIIFYNICGKIFTNYCWNKSLLVDSLIVSKGYGDTVFVGIDCFGRGCPGGGGFKCNIALEMITAVSNEFNLNSSKLSVALFAPGWCYESAFELEGKDLDLHVWRFFHEMVHYLQSYLNNTKVFRQLPQIYINETTLFSTNFDLGQGQFLFIDGVSVDSEPHNNLMDQEIIPSGYFSPGESDLMIKFLPCREFGFRGYGCFKMIISSSNDFDHSSLPIIIELFRLGCHIDRCCDATLNMYLGEDGDIWSNLYMKLTFSIEDSRIKMLEYKIGDIMKVNYVAESSNLQWNHCYIDNLCSRLKEDAEVVLRKVEIIVKDLEVLRTLRRSTLYLGRLSVEATKTKD